MQLPFSFLLEAVCSSIWLFSWRLMVCPLRCTAGAVWGLCGRAAAEQLQPLVHSLHAVAWVYVWGG